MATLDNSKLIIIIVVSTVAGVIAAATILLVYFLCFRTGYTSEKDTHRKTQRIKDMEAQCQVDIRPTEPKPTPENGKFLYSMQDMDSVSTLTQTLALGPNKDPIPMVAVEQWTGSNSKKKQRNTQNRTQAYQITTSGSVSENDENEIKIAVQSKENYLSAENVSQHDTNRRKHF